MISKPTTYSKKFVSEILESPSGSFLEICNKGDLKIREEIIKTFCLKSESTKSKNNEPLGYGGYYEKEKITNFQGFDGRFMYNVKVSPVLSCICQSNEKRPYFLTYTIIKSGKESKLEESCDLEKFLFDNKFEIKKRTK